MSINIKRGLVAAGAVMLATLGAALPAMAHEGETHANATETEQHAKEVREQQAKVAEAKKERIQGKLDEARKKVCATRVEAIKRLMNQSAQQGQKHLEVFNKIAERVNDFYNSKRPNINVANYSELLGAVDTKKAAAMNAIAAVKSGVSFDCNSDNPVGNADQFKAKVRAMHQALKEYRSTINDLLKAVKQAAGENKKQEGAQ